MVHHELVDTIVAPSIGRLEDFRMAIEVDHARTRECGRGENEVQRIYRKQVWILVDAKATSEDADRSRHVGKLLPGKRIERSVQQLPTPGNAFILDCVGWDWRRLEMDNQVGSAFESFHWGQWNIVNNSSVHQHSAIVCKHRRQNRGDRTRGAHRSPERAAANDAETMTG